MSRLLIPLFALALISSIKAQTSASLAADLQAADPAHWPDINEWGIALRNELNATHIANLATASADFSAKLAAANTARDEALAKLSALQTRISTVLSETLTDLQTQLTTAQTALATELLTGDGPQAAAKRLTVTDLQARIDTIQALITEAGKSDKQQRIDAALAAKAAAEKALQDAQAALGN